MPLSIKGFSYSGKLQDINDTAFSRLEERFVTVIPIGPIRAALDTVAMGYYRLTAGATAEAGSNSSKIVLSGHSAKKGDLIRLLTTSNTISEYEITVKSITASDIVLEGVLSAGISTGDTFDILRSVSPRYDSSGAAIATLTQSPIQINRGPGGVFVATTIVKDTTTPGNTIPLPVEIVGASGTAINLTAGDIGIQLTHTGATPDSVRLGDGTTLVSVSASNELLTLPGGNVASGAADSGNPIKMGGVYNLTLPTLDSGDRGNLQLTASGELLVSASLSSAIADQDADSGNPIKIGGKYVASLPTYTDGDRSNLHTDVRGRLVTTSSSSFIEDAASSNADTGLHLLSVRQDSVASSTSTDGDYASIKSNAAGEIYVVDSTARTTLSAISAKLPTAIGQQLSAASLSVVFSTETEAILNAIKVAVEIIDNSISGSETQVDIVSGGPLATQATLATLNAKDFATEVTLDAIHDKLPASLGQKAMAASLAVTMASDQSNLPVIVKGKTVVTTVRNAYASVSVTTGTWVQLVASTGAAVTEMEIFDSSGQTLEIGIGAAASESRLVLLPPGGNGRIPAAIANGIRVAIRAVSATASVGELVINFYGV